MIKRGGTFVRCHCCGEWQLLYIWDTSKRTYCEGCSMERTGNGRGQCAYCQEYPQSLEHWNDPKPDLPRSGLYICIR
jgi:hypothetical protein